MIDASKIAKVRSMLDLAANKGATEGEREAALAAAMKWMAKHNIDQAMLDARQPDRAGVVTREISIGGQYSYERAILLLSIAEVFQATGYLNQHGRTIRAVTLIGHPDDIERAELLYGSLNLQALHGVMRARPPVYRFDTGPRVSTTLYRRRWLYGFAGAVMERLRLAQAEARSDYEHATGTSTALVLRDRRQRAEEALVKMGLKRKGASDVYQGEGIGAGLRAGAEADLDEQRKVEAAR